MKRRYFKVSVTGAWLLEIFCYGTKELAIVENTLPFDAELVSTDFNHDTKCLDLIFLHDCIGSVIPEGGSIKDCMSLIPTYKTVD